MKVFRITSVVVVRSEGQLIVQATGLASSTGWTNPVLNSDDPNPADKVLEFAFEATPPSGISLPVLVPLSASTIVDGKNVDAIIVKARTNSIEVHASEFQEIGAPVTTLAIGEEGPPPSTAKLGEEGPPLTTLRLGEEDPPFTTLANVPGEENPTLLQGEGGTTFRFGEGPLGTDIRVDDPIAFQSGAGLTTLAVGEEGGPIDPRIFGRGTPFGGF
jgi:hypothetical protein